LNGKQFPASLQRAWQDFSRITNSAIINQEEPMVTIDPDKPILNITEQKGVSDRAKTPSGEFGSVFRQAIESTEIKAAGTESAALISALRPARFIVEAPPTTEMVVDRVEQLIETMAAYRQKLMESGATLKEIQPLVGRMSSQSESLTALSTAVAEQENLGAIVNQSLMLASMEIAKYNSGYYNDR
jgi:hypothetical protein